MLDAVADVRCIFVVLLVSSNFVRVFSCSYDVVLLLFLLFSHNHVFCAWCIIIILNLCNLIFVVFFIFFHPFPFFIILVFNCCLVLLSSSFIQSCLFIAFYLWSSVQNWKGFQLPGIWFVTYRHWEWRQFWHFETFRIFYTVHSMLG